MDYSFIIAVIPVILVVAFLVWIAKKITDGEHLDMKEGVLGVVILMVAVLVMVPMISSTQVYTWDEDTGELVIQQNISGGSYAWDTYDDQIRSIVIKPGVTQIGNSAFDGATNLEYLSIPDSVTDIGTNAFGVALKDCLDQTISTPEAGEYTGFGDGTLYFCDSGIFTYDQSGREIQGLSSAYSGAKNIVFPAENNGIAVTGVKAAAFSSKGIEIVTALPDCGITTIGNSTFRSCTDLTVLDLPKRLTSFGNYTANGCTSLTTVILPATLELIDASTFQNDSALESIDLTYVKTIGANAFQGCTSLTSVTFPSTIGSIAANAMKNCTGVTTVAFGSGFAAELATDWAYSWTFYDSDGTTVIDKTSAANLAGFTFQGISTALVKVSPGQLSLTPQQLQQVQLHMQELQDISIEPLPLQPSLQEQELTA